MTATAPATRSAASARRARTRRTRRTRRTQRTGYVFAVAVNLALLWGAHQLLRWRWPAFLTDDFEELLPIVTLSFVATIVVNAAYLVLDAGWFKSIGSVVTSAFGVVVAWRTLRVYPFDFSSYAHDWSWLVTLLLVVAIVGSAIGLVVESVRLVTWPLRAHDPQDLHDLSPG